jgi:hypothetical protein
MDVLTNGTPARWADLPNGHCFGFEIENQTTVGLKIAYPESPNSRTLVLARRDGAPPSLQGVREARPAIVYRLPTLAIVPGPKPDRLRDGIGNPRAGQVMQFENEVYVGFLDEHADPTLVSLKTGLINPNRIAGPVAVFDNWKIIVLGADEPLTLFSYALPAA